MRINSCSQIAASVLLCLAAECGWAQQRAAGAASPRASEGEGGRQFGEKCLNCHGNAAMPAAPEPAALRRMTPEHIYQVLTSGDMKEIAKDISDADKRAIATFVGGRRMMEGSERRRQVH